MCNLTVFAANKTPESILVLGDSLSGAWGIDKDQGWVALLQQAVTNGGYDYRVINASVSGDTTRTGLTRIENALQQHRPAIVIIALGGNDGLRGFMPQQTRANLREMIRLGRAAGARVLLLGIRLPANYGRAFGEKFHQVFLDLAAEEEVPLVPFFLEGVAETRAMMQADGIHPAAEAQPRILDNVWAALGKMLQETAPAAARAAN